MKLDYYEESERGASVSVTQHHSRVTASRRDDKRGVRVQFATCRGDDCDRIDVAFDECFSCEEWDEFLCELSRVCWGDPCDCAVFDQDDDDDCGCEGEVRITVREVREAIKGLHADDVIVLSED